MEKNVFSIDGVDVLIFNSESYKDKNIFSSIVKDLQKEGFKLDLDNVSIKYGKLERNRYKLKDNNGNFYTDKTGDGEVVVIPYFYNTLILKTFKSDDDRLICTKEERHKIEKFSSEKVLNNRVKMLNRKLNMIYMYNDSVVTLNPNTYTDELLKDILNYNKEIYFYSENVSTNLIEELEKSLKRSFYENIT